MTASTLFQDLGLKRPVQTKLFIGGEFVDAEDGETFAVYNPYNNEKIADVAQAGVADIDKAVAVAKEAQTAWARTDAADRGQCLLRLADAIEAEAEELIKLEALDTGHPVRDARKLDVPRTARCFRYFGGMADKVEGFLPPVYPGFINYGSASRWGLSGRLCPGTSRLCSRAGKWRQRWRRATPLSLSRQRLRHSLRCGLPR